MKTSRFVVLLAGVLAFALSSCGAYRTAKRAVVGSPQPARAVDRPTNEYDILRLRIMQRMADGKEGQ